jgi:hypothetical protein
VQLGVRNQIRKSREVVTPMRITIESDSGYAGRAAAQRAADAVRAAVPNADVVVIDAVRTERLPASYLVVAGTDYGVRQMLRMDA